VTDYPLCPVCGFGLWFQPWRAESPADEMCPCCGIQFGYDDAAGGRRKPDQRSTGDGGEVD
jgi:hypothetical protein